MEIQNNQIICFRHDTDLRNKLISLYLGESFNLDQSFDDNTYATLHQFFTDTWFQMPAILTSLQLAEKANSSVYLYRYGYHGAITLCDLISPDLNFLMKVTNSKQYCTANFGYVTKLIFQICKTAFL